MNQNKTLEQQINLLEKRLEKIEKIISIKNLENNTPAALQKKLSVREFLMTKDVDKEIDKVLSLGYFLEKMEDHESFNVSDLEKTSRLAKEQPPKNMNDMINKNIKKGFMMEAEKKKDSKKAWQLTSTGERYVEDHLEK